MNDPLRLSLRNGAVLLVHEDHANPSIAIRGSVRAGAAYGPDGVAEFAARLLFRGTSKRTAAAMSDAIEDLGAALSSTNGDEATSIHGRCTRETLEPTLRLLTESLASPAFLEAEVEKVRGEILGDIRAQQDDTRRAATRRLNELVYSPEHPYGRDPKGSETSVAKVRRNALRAFHETHFGASGMIFALSGDLDEPAVHRVVAPALESLDGGSPPKELPPPKTRPPSHATIPMPQKSQADFVAGRAAVARAHPDFYALNLANLLFGRIGLYGRLGATVRDTLGLAYYSFSVLDARLAGGQWSVSAGVNPKNLVRAVRAIRAEVERLEREPFSDREIQDGKTHLVGALQVNLERNAEYAGALHDVEYFRLGSDYLSRYPEIVREINPDAVRTTARTYFDADACSWVASGPVGDLKIAF